MVTRGNHERIRVRADALEIQSAAIEIVAADFEHVPNLIRRMDAAMALYQSSYSRIACAPTKLGEYLGCGVPCLGSAGVGDMQAILDGHEVGITLHSADDVAMAAAMTEMVDLAEHPQTAVRCRKTAEAIFDLRAGVEAYGEIYESLA